MQDILKDLKENYNVTALKAEFEAEGARLEEVYKLKELALKNNLELTVKIGGCYAKKDLYEALEIGADNIVAPMIETPFAMEKFARIADNKAKYYINIETITGYKNLNEIISSACFNKMSGIVFGRCDMTSSLGLTKSDCNSDIILEIADTISKKMKKEGKNFIIGGGMSPKSVDFLRKMPYISNFETRKVVFNGQINETTPAAIEKALRFEIMWLKNRACFSKEDEARIKMLENLIAQTQPV